MPAARLTRRCPMTCTEMHRLWREVLREPALRWLAGRLDQEKRGHVSDHLGRLPSNMSTGLTGTFELTSSTATYEDSHD